MTLYERCIRKITRPDIIELFGDDLSLLPAETKNDILSVLCKYGFFKDGKILRLLVNKTLVAVDFSLCVVNDDMLSCLHTCTNLRKLHLRLLKRQERKFTKNGLLKLFPNLTRLEVLSIPFYKDFTDEVTKKLCDWCVNLKALYIQYSGITNLSLFLIGQHLHTLCILNILGTNVTDRGIDLLVQGPLHKTLTEVNVDECPYVSPVAKVTLEHECKNVKMPKPKPRESRAVCFRFQGVLPSGIRPEPLILRLNLSRN